MAERDQHRVEVRPGIFPTSPSEPGIRELRLLLANPDVSDLTTLLTRSISGLSEPEIRHEALTLLYETQALTDSVQHLSEESSRGQAACQAVLGQYHATEATVRVFPEDLRPGEADGFVGVAYLVAALKRGVNVRESEGQDLQYAGATYLARAIVSRVAARASQGYAGATPVIPQ